MSDPAGSFDAVAAGYDAARPSYPRESVDWLVDAQADTVVDVGAGTGKFTRLLGERARRVIAVEPAEGMLAQLRQALPDVDARLGTGERMPLPDASADAITFAQSWHWVDVEAASAEAGRVLRPGGTLGLLWNLRDERVGWVRELGAAMRADGDHFRGEPEDPVVAKPFSAPERSLVEWVRECSSDDILDDVRSRSYFPLLPLAEQESVLASVAEVLAAHAGTTNGSVFEMPYVTASFRFRRP